MNEESIAPSRNGQHPSDGQRVSEEPDTTTICSICLSEPPTNAIRLECSHIFCYLCIKSNVELGGNCPECRTEISADFELKDHFIEGAIQVPTSSNGHYWFYEGYRGWWMFDADTNRELELLYQSNREPMTMDKFIAGHVYLIDLKSMTQRRKEDVDSRVRKILRSTLNLTNILGMAGIKGQDFEDILEMMRSAPPIGT